MVVATPYPQESERLAALTTYELLETDNDREFDEVVRLAAAICDKPIALISLIEEQHQWFLARHGVDLDSVPRTQSICVHALNSDGFLEIPDTQADPRTAGNPLCQGSEALRFYAGALLLTSDNLPLGTLCVLDTRPSALTPLQRDTLRVLAGQIMARLELRKAVTHAAMLRQEVDHRVKNSLQSLSSLVRLASRRARHEETVEALSTLNSRIEAVVRLHEELYRTEAGPVIDLGRYVQNLTRHLAKLAPAHVAVEARTQRLPVASGQAVAAGTLINEFVANSFKHAFPDGRAGRVLITVEPGSEAGTIRLICEDDGTGLSDFAEGQDGGLGMEIAAVISAELQGELNIHSSAGGLKTCIEFTALDRVRHRD